MAKNQLEFIKLGGSLITDKDQDSTARYEMLDQLSHEIAIAIKQHPEKKFVIGHGSGSFGHFAAKKYNTRNGFTSDPNPSSYWDGFHRVYQKAHQLHNIVLSTLIKAGVPALSLPPIDQVITKNHNIISWPMEVITACLHAKMVPVVFGDVVFDCEIGGTILSTEELFAHLARQLHPDRILIAGIEEGVWLDFANKTTLVENIDQGNLEQVINAVDGSTSTDVTGGMRTKVMEMVELAKFQPGLSINIFDGSKKGNLAKVISGEIIGTNIN